MKLREDRREEDEGKGDYPISKGVWPHSGKKKSRQREGERQEERQPTADRRQATGEKIGKIETDIR